MCILRNTIPNKLVFLGFFFFTTEDLITESSCFKGEKQLVFIFKIEMTFRRVCQVVRS